MQCWGAGIQENSPALLCRVCCSFIQSLDLFSSAAHHACRFRGIQEAIENGSFQQQATAVALLRLTPVVPFRSAGWALISLLVTCLLGRTAIARTQLPSVVVLAVATLSCSTSSDILHAHAVPATTCWA